MLIKYKAEANASNENGRTPLHLAIMQIRYEACCLLLNSGADPKVRDNKQESPLHMMSEITLCSAHRSHRCKIEKSCYWNRVTILHPNSTGSHHCPLDCVSRLSDICELLLNFGAEINRSFRGDYDLFFFVCGNPSMCFFS